MTEPKTQFEQFYRAFGGYSPGGFNQGGISYLKKSLVEKVSGWEDIVNKLNSSEIIAADRVEVLEDSEYDRRAS